MMPSWSDWLQIALFFLILLSLVKPLGSYMARVYQGEHLPLIGWLQPLERGLYRISGIDREQTMNWKEYLWAMLWFNGLGIVLVYAVQRFQAGLPFNSQHMANVEPWIALNTAVSYVTNTNWQAYAGETTLTYLTQMVALTSQNFLSAASGLALLMAFIRGLVSGGESYLGNYWVDVVRGILYILLPLSVLLAVFLMSQGVIQTLQGNQIVKPLQSFTHSSTSPQVQVIPMGPVASQVAIKQLGSNGGGFFAANAAHPFENPTPLTNFFELLAILLIPAALTHTFGLLVNDRRQGLALLGLMLFCLLIGICGEWLAEYHAHPLLQALDIEGGNMEGKEARFGVLNSALWAVATTASANGSTNAMLDSYTPIGGGIPLWFMQLGEVMFGGVGSGLYGMLLIVIITVFIGGLMVGRTPMYLGKKIEAFEMKMASLAVLLMPIVVLVATAVAISLPLGKKAIAYPGIHGLTEALYAMTSMMNNNGSAFAGLKASNPVFLFLGSVVMLVGRYWYAIPLLAIAGSLGTKKPLSTGAGTLQTHSLSFLVLLLSIIVILGALSFLPVLALGPIVEQLQSWVNHGT
jgi:K+-transporting ATPase ATPase A chain